MNVLEDVINKLKTVQRGTRSEASKLVLEDCIKDLTELEKELFEKEQVKKIPPTFKIGDKLKINPEKVQHPLSEEGKALRLLANMIEPTGMIWCVDPTGKNDSCYIHSSLLMLADD